MITESMERQFFSYCCGAEISMPDGEISICPSCKKITEVISEESEIVPKKAKPFPSKVDYGRYDLKNLLTNS